MRRLLVVCAMTAVIVPLAVQSASTQAGPEAGKVQAARRAGPAKGAVPRLPDGTVNLMDGVWVGGGPVNDMESQGGLKKGEMDALMLPWAKALMATRDETQEPHNACLPMGVPRVTPFPYRFVQNYTHKAPTHMFILHEGNIHTYRQIFMDGRKHPAELDPTWLGHSIGRFETKDTLRHRHGGLQRQVLVRPPRASAHRAAPHHRALDAAESRRVGEQVHAR